MQPASSADGSRGPLLPEVLNGLGMVLGWALVTGALASFLGVVQVWSLAAGLFVLSLVGWKHMGVIFREGLYTLTRNKRG